MKTGQKLITFSLWGLLLFAMAGVIIAKFILPSGPALPVLFPAAEFALTDQNAKPLSSSDMRGRPYVAAFVFTQCSGICPRMTSTMADLQGKLPADVHLISFSVDPERDTPPVLKQYAQTYKADESRWHFVTGPRNAALAVVRGMKLPFKDADETGPILHSEKLLLVDGSGNIRGTYDSKDEQQLRALAPDAARLVKEAKDGKTPPRAAEPVILPEGGPTS